MNATTKCIVIHSRPYRVVDEKSGEVNEGLSLRYIMANDMSPTVSESDGSMGYVTAKASLPKHKEMNVPYVPAIYEMTFAMTLDTKSGKGIIKPLDFTYISNIGEDKKKA